MANWQNARAYEETNLHLLEEGPLYDVTFLIGTSKTEVKAHRNILASRSVVFHAMFCGSLAESSSSIEIPDIDEDTFRSLLRFIYTEDCKLSHENVTHLLYAAKKYDIKRLHERCLNVLEKGMSVESVSTVLKYAHQLDEIEMIDKCKTFIFQNADAFLKSVGFLDLPVDLLSQLLESDGLAIEEIKVYEACIKWAKKQLKTRNESVEDEESVRNVLGEMVYLIRFPLIDQNYFAKNISPTKVLSDGEKLEIFQTYLPQKLCSPKFKSQLRDIKRRTLFERFDRRSTVECWEYKNENNGIGFTVSGDRDIFIIGVSIFGPLKNGSVEGCLFLDNDKETIVSKQYSRVYVSSEKHFDILFDCKILLSPGKFYILRNNARGTSYNGKGGEKSVELGGVTVDYYGIHFGNTDAADGRIHGVILAI